MTLIGSVAYVRPSGMHHGTRIKIENLYSPYGSKIKKDKQSMHKQVDNCCCFIVLNLVWRRTLCKTLDINYSFRQHDVTIAFTFK